MATAAPAVPAARRAKAGRGPEEPREVSQAGDHPHLQHGGAAISAGASRYSTRKRERLERERLGDVDRQAPAGLQHQLAGAPRAARVEARRRAPSSSAARSALRTSSGAALGDRGEVAHPGAEQAEPEVERRGARPARGALARPPRRRGRACARPGRRARRPPPRPPPRAARTAAASRSPAASAASSERLPRRARRARRCAPRAPAPRPRRAARGPRSLSRKRGAARRRRRRAAPRRGARRPARWSAEPRLDRLRAEPREAHRAAARAHRLQQRLGLGADQDQVGERRRLLERLQQRVLALLGHRLGGLDHEHPPLALERAVGDLARSPARAPPRPGAGCRAGAARRGRGAARGRRARGGGRRRDRRRRRRAARRPARARRRACPSPRGPASR